MPTIGRVRYFDPYYLYTDTFDTSELLPHEAYGYVRKRGEWIELAFTKTLGAFGGKPCRGLLIPKGALVSKVRDGEAPTDVSLGDEIELIWKDVSHTDTLGTAPGSLMQTRGTWRATHNGCAVIENPVTSRIRPTPIKQHPEKSPRFYVIPFSLIQKAHKLSEL